MILVAHGASRASRRIVFTYVAITHLGGVGTWVAILLLAEAEAIGDSTAISTAPGHRSPWHWRRWWGWGRRRVMPPRAWLPRAHPIAPAPVSALMSGVMIKVAIYALVRVLVDGLQPAWIGVVVLGSGSRRWAVSCTRSSSTTSSGCSRCTRSRTSGSSCSGLGACLLPRSRGAEEWAAFALAAALLHTLNHAVFKALLFRRGRVRESGWLARAPARRPAAAHAVDGRRVPRGGDGDRRAAAAERLRLSATLQALLHVPAMAASATASRARSRSPRSPRPPPWPCSASSRWSACSPGGRHRSRSPKRRLLASRVVALAVACVVLGVAPGLLFGSLVGLAPWADDAPVHVGLPLPGTGSLPTGGIALVLVALTGALFRGRRAAAPAPSWACGQLVEPKLEWTSAGFTKPLRLVLEAVLRPQREVTVRTSGGVVQEVAYTGHVPHLIDERLYRPATRFALAGAARARRLQSGRLGVYVFYLLGLVVVLSGRRAWVLG